MKAMMGIIALRMWRKVMKAIRRSATGCRSAGTWPAHGHGKWEVPIGYKFSRSEDAGDDRRAERSEAE